MIWPLAFLHGKAVWNLTHYLRTVAGDQRPTLWDIEFSDILLKPFPSNMAHEPIEGHVLCYRCVFWISCRNRVTNLHNNIFYAQLTEQWFHQITLCLTQHLKPMRLNRARKLWFQGCLPKIKQIATGKGLVQVLWLGVLVFLWVIKCQWGR